jgi:predicted CXXCH cytochrome family protein
MRVFLLTALLLVPLGVQAQLKTDSSKECVICHVTWGDDFSKLEPLLSPVDHPLMIDGQSARVSSEKMCWSCHDAYVSDSRSYFLDNDPHMQTPKDPDAIANSGMPLAADGEMYCGTCHTPHANKMDREYSFSPFQRMDIVESALCITCHAEHAAPDRSHPIHVALEDPLPLALAGDHVSTKQVECLSCHSMHSHQPLKLAEGKNNYPLCISCHESEKGLLGSDHQVALEHPGLMIGSSEKKAGDVDVCAACHTTHGAKGKDLWAWDLENGTHPVLAGVDARCLSCHNDDGAAKEKAWKGHGHPIDSKVESCSSKDLPLDDQGHMSCTSCHNPHQWSSLPGHKPAAGNDDGNALTSFLRLPDDQNSRLCTACHEDQGKALASDHNSMNWKDATPGQCSSCHNTHESTSFSDDHAQKNVSAFTSLCLSCHEGEGHHGATSVGPHGHSIAVEMDASSGLPGYDTKTLGTLEAADAKRLGSTLMVGCESCHDPHVWSPVGLAWDSDNNDGNEATSFLVKNNDDAGLCVTCHEDEKALVGSTHDMSAQKPGQSACSVCHATHQAASEWADLRVILSDDEMATLTASAVTGTTGAAGATASLESDSQNWSLGARHCLSCHQDGGDSRIAPEAWAHPQEYETLAGAYRADGGTMPLFGENGPTDGALGRIDCISCHNPHVAQTPGEGESTPDYLRQTSSQTACADCHGEKALWKYRYYHNSLKRELP